MKQALVRRPRRSPAPRVRQSRQGRQGQSSACDRCRRRQRARARRSQGEARVRQDRHRRGARQATVTYTMAAPKGWASQMKGFASLHPADDANLGFFTELSVGSNCDGTCEPKEWGPVADKVNFKQFAADKVIKNETTPNSRLLIASRERQDDVRRLRVVGEGRAPLQHVHRDARRGGQDRGRRVREGLPGRVRHRRRLSAAPPKDVTTYSYSYSCTYTYTCTCSSTGSGNRDVASGEQIEQQHHRPAV